MTGLRLGDAERQRAADALAEHYAAGRLDVAEHSDRLERVWAAKTYDEIPGVFADLPGGSPVAQPAYGASWTPYQVTPAQRAAGRPVPQGGRRDRAYGPVGLLLILLAVVAVVAIVSEHVWILFVALGVWFCGVKKRRRHGWR